MPNRPVPSAVVFVRNVPHMARFYRELFALRELHADADHVVLETDGIQLVIHGLPREPPQPEGAVPVRADSYIKLCLPVRSIAEARAVASGLGGRLEPASAEWEARGFRACDGNDPEGNVIQVRVAAG